jgi:hypothetical protein
MLKLIEKGQSNIESLDENLQTIVGTPLQLSRLFRASGGHNVK